MDTDQQSGLWGAPTAKGLFRAAILQSDPMVRFRQKNELTGLELRVSVYDSAVRASQRFLR